MTAEYGPLLVDMPTNVPATRSNWWDIWTAGVAVYNMCIQKGKKGTAINLGKTSHEESSVIVWAWVLLELLLGTFQRTQALKDIPGLRMGVGQSKVIYLRLGH